MIKPIQSAEHYSWGDNCDGWHLLKTGTLSVIQEKRPPGTSEQRHFHTHAQQLFYILAGIATFELEGQTFEVNTNESIHIPREARHCIANKSDKHLHFLVISEPKAHGDRQQV